MGNGKLKIVEIVVNAELMSAITTFFGNVLRQNKGNLPMISS